MFEEIRFNFSDKKPGGQVADPKILKVMYGLEKISECNVNLLNQTTISPVKQQVVSVFQSILMCLHWLIIKVTKK